MKQVRVVMLSLLTVLLCSLFSAAQQSVMAATNATVPPLIPFSSVATDEGGSSLSGVVNITFSLYAGQQGGAPLWTETQNNIQLDPTGHYSVQLGITQPNGVPTTLFTTTEARWLGVRIAEQVEQPRVLLLSVPYALKAGDAATIGGLPPSAFVLAAPPFNSTTGSPQAAPLDASAAPPSSAPPTGGAVTGTGTVNFLPLWDTTSDIISSVLFQSGTGATAKVGINTTTPASTLDVKGSGTIRGTLSLPATGTATATKATNSQPMTLAASAFNTTSGKAVAQTFQWQAEPVGNDTATNSATLNLLFGSGTTKPAETGLNIASTGVVTFNTAQTFPNTIAGVTTATGSGLTGGGTSGTLNLGLLNTCATNQVLQWTGTAWACATVSSGGGSGTVTSVATGLGLTGGPITTSGTLTIDPSVVPQLGAANTFTGNQTVKGNVISTTGYEIQFAGTNYLFDYGSPFIGSGLGNSYLGFAGNSVTTGVGNVGVGSFTLVANTSGQYNTAVGLEALLTNSSGEFNTAVGTDALFANGGGTTSTGNGNTALGYGAAYNNLTGYDNTAVGFQTMFNNTTGVYNTATGGHALSTNTTGNYNTAVGYQAGPTTANLTNSTAVGANALVSESNALVLGGTGSNAVSVGIGTASPLFTLDVHGTANFTGNVTFAPSQSFSGTGGIINATTGFDIGGTPFAFGSTSTFNSFLGFSGNSTVTGTYNFAAGQSSLASASTGYSNTAVGSNTAFSITTGFSNTAVGGSALNNDVSGYQNTAVGAFAAANTNGTSNTAVGQDALYNDKTGTQNTALGFAAGPDAASPSLANATAIGAGATVSQSNSLVLGQTMAGSPGKAFANVGIGTATPRSILETSVYAPASTNGGLGPTITLTNSAGGGNTSTSLDFNSYAPATTGTYNPAARILVTDAGSFSDNFLFQSNIPGKANNALQTNMEIYSAGGMAVWGSNASSTSSQPGGIGITATGGSNTDFAANGGEGGNFTGGIGITAGSGVTVAGGSGDFGGDGIDAAAGGGILGAYGYAGNFSGDINVTGSIFAGTKDFKIDHPLDPANQYLYHSSVESSEMMNIYTGNVTTDSEGFATVHLPDWFEAVNTDFRYQLTVIGQFAQAIVNSEVTNHQFGIRTDKPNVKVSWQITGVRQDAYAKAHPLVVEQAKDTRERGHYIHPELYGAPEEQSIEWARHPEMMKKMQETRAQQLAAAHGQATTTRAETLPLAVPPTPKEVPQRPMPRVAPVRPAASPKPPVRAELQPLAPQPM